MDLFGKFRKLDTSLQRGLDNGFARVFGGEVVPTEIDEMLKQQAEDSVMVNSDGDELAPSFFIVHVAPRDRDSLLEGHPSLMKDLSNRLSRFIRNEGWTTNDQVAVDLRADEELHSGQMKTDSRFSIPESFKPKPAAGQAQWPESDVSPRQSAAQDYDAVDSSSSSSDATPSGENEAAISSRGLGSVVRPSPGTQDGAHAAESAAAPEEPAAESDAGDAAASEEPVKSYPGTTVITHAANDEVPVRGGTGVPHDEEHQMTVTLVLRDGSDRQYELLEGSNLIGRGNTVDLRIPDTGVSRQHAEVVWDGFDAVLTDLQSTNGTTVNDTPIENWLLADGDVIKLGHSEIEVHFQE